jgi:uncharacterized protein (TIGR02186 family)
MIILRITAALLLVCCTAASASAQQRESVETDISSRNIAIESNFTGAEIVVFGTIANSRQTDSESGLYDLAVVIRGPEEPMVTRRKERVMGVWINTRSREFQNVPGYYAVLSTRPLEEIADKETLLRYGIGYESLLLERKKPGAPPDPFREAVIRIMNNDGLYRRSEDGVSFIGSSLFRATFQLPANVPNGEYWAEVFAFAEGEMISHSSTRLTIRKEGFERFVYNLAFEQPLLYGVLAVITAMLAGLLASAIFRKD